MLKNQLCTHRHDLRIHTTYPTKHISPIVHCVLTTLRGWLLTSCQKSAVLSQSYLITRYKIVTPFSKNTLQRYAKKTTFANFL
jgi:hypothetical protein